jgi:predicted DNA-binding protein with PD1-like motif
MDPKNLVYRLRKNHNIKVGVRHYRWTLMKLEQEEGIPLQLRNVTKDNKKNFTYIHGHGGATEVHLTFPDGKNYEERARCVMTDPFCKKIGVVICVGRILKMRKEQGIIDNIKI